ncbi:hypothetical protein [Kibdelosporangium aridum]|uniref:Gram-positive cocci surface proteins LPxTG domain-containing protein n=1 Tax=Kibdelosporangium aridum TaxID=2030 RepID=A0A1Y5XCP6_KIBAR|nr:hypothetical protein [Kibdelosporangium aridum]SMC86266.1 hypothetical protein SAMN05661093_02337 [Kibdelosporangium aridum]
MRIRSTVAGLALGAGVLFLGAPIAMADNAQPAPPTSTQVTERPSPAPPTTTRTTAPPTSRPATLPPAPSERPAVVKPVGAPETGGGMDESSSPAGALAIGGIALVVLAAGGSVIYRRTRKQG